MADTRKKDSVFDVTNQHGIVPTWDCAQVAVLMDLRDEMKRMNAVLNCSNCLAIPGILRSIDASLKVIRDNTTKKRRKARAK